eukprot:TRINITY_DN11309_c0_g1_i1.p1 TRINITY_DN11309_c0_g1~~TRINITY_DN11309_c0_g1_i1.p1  ORF type:complete len:686 (-),score=149.25 TRINITY_DN11309_c0_g1_i1:20-2077(-)
MATLIRLFKDAVQQRIEEMERLEALKLSDSSDPQNDTKQSLEGEKKDPSGDLSLTEPVDAQFDPVKECFDGVQTGIEEKRYEDAVDHIQKFYRDFFCMQEEVNDVYIELIESVEEKLKTVIKQNLDESISKHQLIDVERFSALYSGLGMKEEGLQIYVSQYVEELVANEVELVNALLNVFIEKSKKSMEQKEEDDLSEFKVSEYKEGEEEITTEENQLNFVEAARRLYEYVAGIVEDKYDFITKYFGEKGIEAIAKVLQSRTDTHICTIYKTFIEHFRFIEIITRINMIKMASQDEGSEPVPMIDPRNLTALLGQMSLLSQCDTLFDKYICRKLSIARHPYQRHSLVKEIITYYNILEEYFMNESSKKAIRMNSLESADKKTSSMVDNVFYVLKQCSHRALSAANSNSVCSIVNMLCNILNLDYKQVLIEMVSDSFEGRGTMDPKVNLNNIEVSSDYALKLKMSLESEAEKLFEGSIKELEMIKVCLAELETVSKVFKDEILMPYMREVCDRLIPGLSRIIHDLGFAKLKYDLNEEKYLVNEVNDPFIENFLFNFDDRFGQYKSTLTANNYGYLVLLALDYFLPIYEKKVMNSRFTLLGGLQLSREVKRMNDYFLQYTKTSRQKLSRLSQMASLLSLEKPLDVLDIWGEKSSIKWKLTPQEVIAVLERRQDFLKPEIATLKLSPL